MTLAIREKALTRADGPQIAARLVAAVTDAVAMALGEQHRGRIVVDLVATRDDRTAVGGRLVNEAVMSEPDELRDRVEIEALRAEFTDAAMMNDHDQLASLFMPDGVVRIPDAGIEAAGRDGIRSRGAGAALDLDLTARAAAVPGPRTPRAESADPFAVAIREQGRRAAPASRPP
ncbi:hypothetical protein [Streptomyces sp. NPDC050564]|uniref:hypothetical protein n=1 Tax=Streptomyces sp. NPDC050564 TaxID=3365631 RepID=UPI00379C2127